MLKTWIVSVVSMAAGTMIGVAGVFESPVEYKHGTAVLEGFVAYDNLSQAKRPVVLIVHQWKGLGEYEKMRARMLAEMGYLAFAVDIYGKGIRAEDREQARKLATLYRSDRKLMRARVAAGLEAARRQQFADSEKVAAIGYCFGGGVVLELARSGADVRGVVSFHGNLDTPDPADARNIKCGLLVCHGAADSAVPPEQVEAFRQEMEAAKVDYQLIMYSGAVHAFTDKFAGERFQADADRRSWAHMRQFFTEVLLR